MKTLTGASQYSVCTPEQPHPKARCTENIAPAILHSQLPSNVGQSWKKWEHFSDEIRKDTRKFVSKNCIWMRRVKLWKNNCNEIWKIHKIIWKFGYLSKSVWKFDQKYGNLVKIVKLYRDFVYPHVGHDVHLCVGHHNVSSTLCEGSETMTECRMLAHLKRINRSLL